MDGTAHPKDNNAVEMAAERLAREILIPGPKLERYAHMEHSIFSAKRIAKENSMPVASVLARLTYDTNTWDDIGLGIYTTYAAKNGYKSYITSPYHLDNSYYSSNLETGYIGASFNGAKAQNLKFPEIIHVRSKFHGKYEISYSKDGPQKGHSNGQRPNAAHDLYAVISGISQPAIAFGLIAASGFEESVANARNIEGIQNAMPIGNTFIMLLRYD